MTDVKILVKGLYNFLPDVNFGGGDPSRMTFFEFVNIFFAPFANIGAMKTRLLACGKIPPVFSHGVAPTVSTQ